MNIEEKLQQPFPPEDIEWRVQSSGISNGNAWALIMPYVTNRAIQERLDNVFGVFGWENEFREVKQEGKISFLCGITAIKKSESDTNFPNTVTKWDGADETNFENFKGGLSNSMKRAGVQFGIGRYLYKLDTAFAELSESKYDGSNMVKIKDGATWKRFYYNPPQLPEFALPNYEEKKTPAPEKKEPVEEVLGGRDLTAESDACKNLPELAVWYGNLPSEYKKAGSPVIAVKDARKKAIQVEQEQASQSTPAQEALKHVQDSKEVKEEQLDYSFESLKTKTVAILKQIAKEMEITGYSKMDKPTLITTIIKARG